MGPGIFYMGFRKRRFQNMAQIITEYHNESMIHIICL